MTRFLKLFVISLSFVFALFPFSKVLAYSDNQKMIIDYVLDDLRNSYGYDGKPYNVSFLGCYPKLHYAYSTIYYNHSFLGFENHFGQYSFVQQHWTLYFNLDNDGYVYNRLFTFPFSRYSTPETDDDGNPITSSQWLHSAQDSLNYFVTHPAISDSGEVVQFSTNPSECGLLTECSGSSLDNPNDMLCEHNYHGGNMTINGKRREY